MVIVAMAILYHHTERERAMVSDGSSLIGFDDTRADGVQYDWKKVKEPLIERQLLVLGRPGPGPGKRKHDS